VPVDAAWAAVGSPGLEHVIVAGESGGWRADGEVIMTEDQLATVRYQVRCDTGWRFRELTISVTGSAGERALDLVVTADGGWLANGQPRADLAGCIDIDINCTPLTNTLPIRRLSWSAGQARDLGVAYVTVPELAVAKAEQRYTLLTPAGKNYLAERQDPASLAGCAVFRYESGSFQADLPVDANGLVLDYPGIWQRVTASHSRAA